MHITEGWHYNRGLQTRNLEWVENLESRYCSSWWCPQCWWVNKYFVFFFNLHYVPFDYLTNFLRVIPISIIIKLFLWGWIVLMIKLNLNGRLSLKILSGCICWDSIPNKNGILNQELLFNFQLIIVMFREKESKSRQERNLNSQIKQPKCRDIAVSTSGWNSKFKNLCVI